ncbi:bifunctional polysaccharide deacetylase/glycosyltransferase family 2 protein [Actinomycetospora cinnamomea]|uniref:Cellulose synthase/poly-beta-1,6-N-acetylglucosamine synthase-like glycosyltransferase n=1 Tax=Actinomycetospora cinnamomea TaxID=663609 RepID=A0A2U1FQF2_9PSEU|nr:bifunctional polysaccharide deacetylase/glycosyltransferase family 2 protein [Actinomycetospora cinnamomea]PVZ14379.1 cellulose synthase/poly-beta-1,6-N-acetylglucosamine synthase-like glycosyltransferase [Actinomycetospora cinnamomea]
MTAPAPGATEPATEPATETPVRWRPRLPGPAVWLAVLFSVMLTSVLALNGLTNAKVAADQAAAEPAGTATVPDTLLNGGPVISAAPGGLESRRLPDRTIALTFDDGPDPRWTPEVLAVLRKHRVPATFFVVGSVSAQHPELLRAIRDQGSALGVHSFTHPDLTTVSGLQAGTELGDTQLVINGAVRESTYLLRPPYSSTPRAIDDPHYASLRETAEDGYTTVLTDYDSEDWRHPGIDAIVANSTPPDGRGGVVLMHDAGGDRSETVAALDRLIPTLKAQGYRFTTPTEAVGLPAPDRPVGPVPYLLGQGLMVAVDTAGIVVSTLTWMLLVLGGLVLSRLVLMMVVAARHRRRRDPRRFRWGPPVTEPVSVIVPAYNEKENIAATIRSLVASDHPVEVVVVDDGSDDGTADIAEGLGLPNVRVVRQPNGGKPSALNNGIAHARYRLVVMIDGDTVFERETVRRLVQPFADPTVGAVSGNAKVAANAAGRRRLIASWQHIEYVIGFNVDRRVYDLLRCMPTIPGAVGAFRRDVLLAVGGVSDDTLAEDTDVTMAVCRRGWRVVYEETARAWTEAPATLGQLWRQRYRWSYGTMQSMWKHRRAVFHRGPSGRFGRMGLAQLAAFQIVLPVLAPLVDLFLVYGLLFLDPVKTLGAWGGMLGLQLCGAVFAFRLEREKLGVLWLLPVQQLVYRQLMYAVLIRSVVTAVAGIRLRWQKLRRVGGLDELVGGAPADLLPLPPARGVRPGASPGRLGPPGPGRPGPGGPVPGRPGTGGPGTGGPVPGGPVPLRPPVPAVDAGPVPARRLP